MTDSGTKYYIGIDGGGTKTKFLVGRVIEGCSADGTKAAGLEVIGEYTSSGCHYLDIGFEGLEELIRSGVAAACNNAGIIPADVAFAFAGCAGFGDIASDQAKIDPIMKSAFGEMPFAAENDSANALEGALNGAPGINIIAGTGSIGSGRNASGQFMRAGGWHYLLGGDEGSAYWIAWNLLKEYSRQSDGRDEKTLLYDAVNKELDLHSDDEQITRVIYDWEFDRPRIARLAPLVSRLYDEGDPYAAEILSGCAKEFADLAIALYDRLGFADGTGRVPDAPSDEPIPVSGTGGVFKIGPAVIEPFDRILQQHGMKYVAPFTTPDMGALMLAVKHGLTAPASEPPQK